MNIEFNILVSAACLIFSILLFIIARDKKQIAELNKLLEKERNRRSIPFLNMAIDRNQLILRLVNEGSIIANNITIEDVSTVVDIGFQKNLLFRFSPVESLKPGEAAALDIKIFEKDQPIPPGMLQRMGGVLINISFKAYVHCENMEGVPFCTELIKNGQKCKISRVALAEKDE